MKMMFAAGPNTLAAAFLNCYIPYEKRLARSASLRFIFAENRLSAVLKSAHKGRNQLLLAGYDLGQIRDITCVNLRAEAFHDQLRSILAVAQKACILVEDIGEHEEYHAHAALRSLDLELRTQLVSDLQKLVCIHGADLTDTECSIAKDELLEILMKDLVRSLVSESAARAEHCLRLVIDIHAGDLSQSKTCDLISRCACRRSEEQSVGYDSGHHETCDVRRNLNAEFMEH